jgi:tRNA 2-thiouridine synthesizing protein A
MSDQTNVLDVRHQLCPIPVIRTQNTVARLSDGERLTVLCTDPGTLSDIPAWCRINGHQLLSATENGDDIEIVLQVRKP